MCKKTLKEPLHNSNVISLIEFKNSNSTLGSDYSATIKLMGEMNEVMKSIREISNKPIRDELKQCWLEMASRIQPDRSAL